MAAVLKTASRGDLARGFESHALRFVISQDIEDTANLETTPPPSAKTATDLQLCMPVAISVLRRPMRMCVAGSGVMRPDAGSFARQRLASIR